MFPQNSYIEILVSSVMFLGGGSLGLSLGVKGGALMNDISAFVRDPTELPSPF